MQFIFLKQGQGHKNYNDNADPKQDYNHAKLSCFNCVREKANVKVFFKRLTLIITQTHIFHVSEKHNP